MLTWGTIPCSAARRWVPARRRYVGRHTNPGRRDWFRSRAAYWMLPRRAP